MMSVRYTKPLPIKSGNGGKFVQGHNEAVTTEETLWHTGGLFPWSAVGSNAAVTAVSSDAADTLLGTGAQVIRLFAMEEVTINSLTGLKRKLIDVPLNGVTPVTDIVDLAFIDAIQVIQAGSGNKNAGVITLTIGGTTVATIDTGENRSRDAVYIIPQFNENGAVIQGGYITDLLVTMIGPTNAYAWGNVWASIPYTDILFSVLSSTISLDKDLGGDFSSTPWWEPGTKLEIRAADVSTGSVEIFCNMHIRLE